MNTISLCIIAKNASRCIARCLKSVKDYVDEIIVVDTGSKDETPEIARKFGAKVYTFPWNNDLSAARNFSLDKATQDWILIMDADEELLKGTGEKLRELVSDNQNTGYFLKIIKYISIEGALENCADMDFRLFKNNIAFRYHGKIYGQIADVILKEKPEAKYKQDEDVILVHYNYNDSEESQKNKKEKNLQIIEAEVKENQEDYLLRYHYGLELFSNEDYEQATKEFLKVAKQIDKSSMIFPKLLRYIIISMLNCEKYAKGERYCEEAQKIFPDYADLYFYHGLILYQQKKYSMAFEKFKKAQIMPEQPAFYASFPGVSGFRNLYYCGKIAEEFLNFDLALEFYLDALRENAFFTAPLEEIVRLLDPKKDPEYTKECLEKVFVFESAEAYKNLGFICYHLGGYKLALEYLNKVGDDLAKKPEILLIKAICSIQLGERLSVLRMLKNFPKDHFLYPLALINLFFYYWLQENKKKLNEIYQEMYGLNVSSDTATVLDLFRGSLYKKNLKNLIYLNTNSKILFLDLFKRIVDCGALKKAEILISKIAETCVNDLSFELGKIYLDNHYGELAEKYFLLAEKNSNNSATLLYLAETYEMLEQKNQAISYYKRVIATNANASPKVYIKIIELYQQLIEETLTEAVQEFPEVEELKTLFFKAGLQYD